MKTKILVVLFALALSANLRAQVTISELVEPAKGALLDLNKTTKGGLLLSNVKLNNLYTIPATFPGMSSPSPDANTKFTGSLVYHTGGNGIAAGIYVWNGTNWAPVEENCTPLTPDNLMLAGPPFAQFGDALTFSVSTNTSAICSGEETYKWYTSGLNNDVYTLIEDGTVSSFTTSFGSVGTYKVKVEVKNRYSTLPATKIKTVEITNGTVPAAMLNKNYGLVGAVCLDVHKNKQPASQSQEAFDARINAFAGGSYEKTYKFIHSNAYSDLSLDYIDPANLVEAITVYPPASAATGGTDVDGYYEEEFKIKFRSNIQDLVPPNGDSLTIKLVASYKPDGSSDIKWAYLEIRVEDGTCVCPAKISDTEWKNFMCHNLGGLDIISPSQLVTRAHHGDWYRWGTPTASVRNLDATTDAAPAGWNYELTSGATPPYTPYYQDYQTYGDGVDWLNDPCPAGWRLPTYDNLRGLANYGSWTSWPGNTFSSLVSAGKVYMPLTGHRKDNDGSLVNRDNAAYCWGSSSNAATYGNVWIFSFGPWGTSPLGTYTTNRAYAYPVRCVAD